MQQGLLGGGGRTEIGGGRGHRSSRRTGLGRRFEETSVKAEHIKVGGGGRFCQQKCVMRRRHQRFQTFHDHGR